MEISLCNYNVKKGKCLIDGTYLDLNDEVLFLGEVKLRPERDDDQNGSRAAEVTDTRGFNAGSILSVSKFPSENPNPVFRLSYNGELLYANQACIEQLGSGSSMNGHSKVELDNLISDMHKEVN